MKRGLLALLLLTGVALAGNSTGFNISLVVPDDRTFTLPVGTGSVVVQVPAGLLSPNYVISIDLKSLNDGLQSLQNPVYELSLIDCQNSIAVSHAVFTRPLRLSLPYNGSVTQKGFVKYWDTTVRPYMWRKEGVEVVSVNTEGHTIMADIYHLTEFSVFSYDDSVAPIIQSVKADQAPITNGGYLGTLPNFKIDFTDSQPSDSGVVSYNIRLQKLEGLEVVVHQGALANSAAGMISLTVNTPLQNGQYILFVAFEDDAENIVTLQVGVQVVTTSLTIQNFMAGPNPVNINKSIVHFTYDLSKDAATTIRIFDVAGRRVRQIQSPLGGNGGRVGQNDVLWDGRTDQGDRVPASLYLVFISSDEMSLAASKRFMLLVTK